MRFPLVRGCGLRISFAVSRFRCEQYIYYITNYFYRIMHAYEYDNWIQFSWVPLVGIWLPYGEPRQLSRQLVLSLTQHAKTCRTWISYQLHTYTLYTYFRLIIILHMHQWCVCQLAFVRWSMANCSESMWLQRIVPKACLSPKPFRPFPGWHPLKIHVDSELRRLTGQQLQVPAPCCSLSRASQQDFPCWWELVVPLAKGGKVSVKTKPTSSGLSHTLTRGTHSES